MQTKRNEARLRGPRVPTDAGADSIPGRVLIRPGLTLQTAVVRIGRFARMRLTRVVRVARLRLGVAGIASRPRIGRRRRGLVGAGHVHLPNSKTTSRLIDSEFSPGETEVSDAAPAFSMRMAIIGIGIGGAKRPPSLTLTIRRTFMPRVLA